MTSSSPLTPGNLGRTAIRPTRRSTDPMADFDALPPPLRRWLAHADLPWSPASCLKLWRKYRGAGLPTDQVLDQLARLQARKLARLDMTAKLFPPSGE